MRVLKWLSIFICLVLVGCSQQKLSKEDQVLVDDLMKDYEAYFHFPITVNDFSAKVEKQDSLVDKETDELIYNGDRVTLFRKGEPKDNEVIRITGEYKDDGLNGIFVEIHSKPTEYSEESLEQLAVAFLNEHQLAKRVSLIEQKVKENEREIIFRFQTESDSVIKVYVNQDLKVVVGFLITDGEDL